MDIREAIDTRISCRAYSERPVEQDKLAQLQACIDEANTCPDLHFQLYGPRTENGSAIDMSPKMFSGTVSHYAALAGTDDDLTREEVGYFGEKLVLLATQLGLGTCWVASTFDRDTCRVDLATGEVLHDVVPIGYAMERTPLKQRTIRAGLRGRDKKPEQMMDVGSEEVPQWFRDAVDAVLKGPSAINEQPVVFSYRTDRVTASIAQVKSGREHEDLGIAKLHFEIGSGYRGRWGWGDGAEFILS